MRIVRIRVPAFGGLTELDTGEATLSPLVVVQGRNESGKSTFFELVATLLYGFYPASRDTHDYTPWSGETAHVEAELRVGDAPAFQVRRRLLASPTGTLIRDGAEEDLRNRTLPAAGHVNRKVYRQVFALTLAEMAGLEGREWEEIQDRLFGGLGARDLRSTREVAEALEAEAKSLWRPDGRGKPEVRRLQGELRELGRARRAARDDEEEIRSLSVRLEEARARRDELRQERHRLQAELDRYEVLRPIRDRLAQIADLRDAAGDPDELANLPGDPRERLDSLEARLAEIREHRRALAVRRKAAEAERAAFTDDHQVLLERSGEIREALASRTRADARREEAERLERSIQARRTRMEEIAASVLDRPLDDRLRAALRQLSIAPLSAALRALDDAGNQLRALSELPGAQGPLPPVLPLWLPLVGFGIAAGLLALALSGAGGLSTLPGWFFAAAGLLLLGWRIHTARRREEEVVHREARRQEWEAERARREAAVSEAREKVDGILAPLGPGKHAAEPRLDWTGRLEQLRSLVLEDDGDGALLAEVRAELDGISDTLTPLVRLIPGGGDDDAPPDVAVHLLEMALQDARDLRKAARDAGRTLEELRIEDEDRAADAGALERERTSLSDRISRLGDGSLDSGLSALTRRREARTLAHEYRKELQGKHPDLARKVEEIRDAEDAGEDWLVDPGTVARTRTRTDDVEGELRELEGRMGEMRSTLEHLEERARLDDLDGAIAELEMRKTALGARRDRLWLLSRIVREADRRIRDAHQPATLRTAGRHLARLTGGRYDQFVQAGDDGRDFRVRGPGLSGIPGTVPSHDLEPPLSQGTLEQMYLALRLAMLDEIDGGGVRLPLLLDEVMVNWDEERRNRGLDLLAEVAQERQCFFFTCHRDMAAALEERGARRIVLPDPVTPAR